MRTIGWLVFSLFAWQTLAGAASRRPYGGQIDIPVTTDIDTTDPARVSLYAELELARQIHDTLFRMTSGGEVVPSLAQDLPRISDDGKEWVVQLRPGLQFHDGSSITATDFIASWQRLLDAKTDSPHWWLLASIQGALAYREGKSTRISGLEKINKLSFRIRLKVAVPGFLEVMAALPTAPLPARALSGSQAAMLHPPGSGPFAWEPGVPSADRLMLKANLKHAMGRPYLDRLAMVRYPSPRAARLAFELEEVHLTRLPPSHRRGPYQTDDGPQTWMTFLALNPVRLDRLPRGFRHAVENAIDRRSLVKYLIGDRGIPTDEVVGLGDDHVPAGKLDGDPQAAKEYFKRLALESRGVPPVLTFLVPAGEELAKSLAERVQVNLVDIGVVVSVVELEHKEYLKRIREGDYDFFLARPLALVQDPELQMMSIVSKAHVDRKEAGDAGFQSLLDSLSNLPGGENRSAIVREMARRYQVKLTWIPLFQYGRRAYFHAGIRGIKRDANGLFDLAETWLAR